MLDEPSDDWYEWRRAGSSPRSAGAAWLVALAVVMALLLAPLLL